MGPVRVCDILGAADGVWGLVRTPRPSTETATGIFDSAIYDKGSGYRTENTKFVMVLMTVLMLV